MASYQYTNSSNQVRNSRFTDTRHGYSKSQMCFFKILHVISSVSPSQNTKGDVFLSCGDNNHNLGSLANRGIGIDLNLSSAAGDNGKSEYSGSNSEAEKSVEVSEVTNVQVVSFDKGYDREETKFEKRISVEDEEQENRRCQDGRMETAPFEEERHENDNCLDLLIEAAKLISGNSTKEESNIEEPSGNGGLSNESRPSHLEAERVRKRNQNCMVVDLCSEINDMSPVVKSKRGRSQALPYRFRDSVVEPLRRSARTQRQPSTATSSSRKLPIGS